MEVEQLQCPVELGAAKATALHANSKVFLPKARKKHARRCTAARSEAELAGWQTASEDEDERSEQIGDVAKRRSEWEERDSV